MYKVFVNDRPIILTENENYQTNLKKILFNQAHIYELVNRLLYSETKGVCLICNNLPNCWDKFNEYFTLQISAGGKVINKKNEILFIYRYDRWDLPKGKIEEGEKIEDCALREVEEECGITGLTILKKLKTTYHIFEFQNKKILKFTDWYLMKTDYQGKLTPQIKEHIYKAEFKNEKQVEEALQNTYENIKTLF